MKAKLAGLMMKDGIRAILELLMNYRKNTLKWASDEWAADAKESLEEKRKAAAAKAAQDELDRLKQGHKDLQQR